MSFAIGALTLAAVALVCAIVLINRFKPADTDAPARDYVEAADQNYVDVNDLPDSQMVLKSDTFSDEYLPENAVETPEPEPELDNTPTPEPTPEPTIDPNDPFARVRPTPVADGMLPVFKKADFDEKVIAITLDECGDVKLMGNFVNMANHFKAKLTLFPTGENIMKNGMGQVLKACLFNHGFEIENRGYSELARVHQYVDSLMVQEIWKQSVALNFVLGVKYQPHFYRMYGGMGEYDRRTHAFLKQQGYLGVAHWTVSCTGMDIEDVPDKLTPGGIYAFRCSQEDGQRMYALMTAARQKGYRMVTLNQMFGYAANEYHQVQGSLLAETMPEFSSDDMIYDLSPGDTSWAVAKLQQRLTALGYLPEGSSDGIFGDATTDALRAFQAESGQAASGMADVAAQQALFAEDAPRNSKPLANPYVYDGEEEDPFADAYDEPDLSDAPEEDLPEEALVPSGELEGDNPFDDSEYVDE